MVETNIGGAIHTLAKVEKNNAKSISVKWYDYDTIDDGHVLKNQNTRKRQIGWYGPTSLQIKTTIIRSRDNVMKKGE